MSSKFMSYATPPTSIFVVACSFLNRGNVYNLLSCFGGSLVIMICYKDGETSRKVWLWLEGAPSSWSPCFIYYCSSLIFLICPSSTYAHIITNSWLLYVPRSSSIYSVCVCVILSLEREHIYSSQPAGIRSLHWWAQYIPNFWRNLGPPIWP